MQTKFIHASKCGKNGKRLSWESEPAKILFAVIFSHVKELPLLILHPGGNLVFHRGKAQHLGSIGCF